ncbi:hypothetical protein TPA0906_16170 [Streptomyces olivaceus]|nr:hypothetical protein TPA0906_16170 [Streptomyces olivaceus]
MKEAAAWLPVIRASLGEGASAKDEVTTSSILPPARGQREPIDVDHPSRATPGRDADLGPGTVCAARVPHAFGAAPAGPEPPARGHVTTPGTAVSCW